MNTAVCVQYRNTQSGGVALQHPRERHFLQPGGLRGSAGNAGGRLLVYRREEARGRRFAGTSCRFVLRTRCVVCVRARYSDNSA